MIKIELDSVMRMVRDMDYASVMCALYRVSPSKVSTEKKAV